MGKTEHLIIWADGSCDRCASVSDVERAVRAYAARERRDAMMVRRPDAERPDAERPAYSPELGLPDGAAREADRLASRRRRG